MPLLWATYTCVLCVCYSGKKATCSRNGADSLVYYCPSPEPLINNVDLLDFYSGTHTHSIPLAFIHHLISTRVFPLSRSIPMSFTPFCTFGVAHVSFLWVLSAHRSFPISEWNAIATDHFLHLQSETGVPFLSQHENGGNTFLRHINQIESVLYARSRWADTRQRTGMKRRQIAMESLYFIFVSANIFEWFRLPSSSLTLLAFRFWICSFYPESTLLTIISIC